VNWQTRTSMRGQSTTDNCFLTVNLIPNQFAWVNARVFKTGTSLVKRVLDLHELAIASDFESVHAQTVDK
jgi:hypothetical protein